MHVHASALDFLIVAAYTLIFSFLWRMTAARCSESALGKAMAAVYS